MEKAVYDFMILFNKATIFKYNVVINFYKKKLERVELDLRFIYNGQHYFYSPEELADLKLAYYNYESLNRIVGLYKNCVVIYQTELTKYQVMKLEVENKHLKENELKSLQDDYIIKQTYRIFDNIVLNDYGFFIITDNSMIYLENMVHKTSLEKEKIYKAIIKRYTNIISKVDVSSYHKRYSNNFQLLKIFLDKIFFKDIPIMDAYNEVYEDLIKFSEEFDSMDTEKPFDEKTKILNKIGGLKDVEKN